MNSTQLKANLKEIRDDLSESHAIRLHRAISWLRCAEDYSDTDDDLCFITLWISFNSCYAVDDNHQDSTERQEFKDFSKKLCTLDTEQHIHNCLWNNFPGFVRLLINNKYVYAPFWASQRLGRDDWKPMFEKSKTHALRSLSYNNTPELLSVVLDRLYVLRNQLLHGGATYQSNMNRDQVVDGKRMLLELMPIVIEIMLNADDQDWGEIFYPVVD